MARRVYLQTDIGGDIDDAWALAMILKSPELDLQMILTDTGNTVYRAALCCRMLKEANRQDVLVGAGQVMWPDTPDMQTQYAWVKHFPLLECPNFTYDGINRFIEMIRAEKEPVALVAIGPVTSLAVALRKAPDIAEKIDLYGMFGSVYEGYAENSAPCPEYNVFKDVEASKTVFSANWHSATITPLDTCGRIRLDAAHMAKLRSRYDITMQGVFDMYACWTIANGMPFVPESSVLYDTVAVFMSFSKDYMKYESLKLSVDDKGNTVIDPNGKPFEVAVKWTDKPGYCDFLTERLLAPVLAK